MPYAEEMKELLCPTCGKVNHLAVAYAADGRANEREAANCYNCGDRVCDEDCFAVSTAGTPEEAKRLLRRVQGRAPL